MEAIGKLTVFIMLLVLASLVSLLGAHVIIKISQLYDLKFLLEFSFVQVYGMVCVFGVLRYKHTKDKKDTEDASFKEGMIKGFYAIASYAAYYLFSWLIAFLMYLIIT